MSDEWYTPARYVEAARAVMGEIDLDPASCELANRIVKAERIYTKMDNGLSQVWTGRVWLNPPFARRQTPGKKTHQGLWVNKLVQEYLANRVTEAVLLTTCRPDTSWFSQLWDYPICFVDHKVGFYTPQAGKYLQEVAHGHGTLFVYLGPHHQRFLEHFSPFGTIAQRISPVPTMFTTPDLWAEVLHEQ